MPFFFPWLMVRVEDQLDEDWAMTPAELIAHIREHFLSNPLYSA